MSIKPFWIEITEDITSAMVAEVFDKAVAQGAKLYEGVKGFHMEGDDTVRTYNPSMFNYIGVDADQETIFTHDNYGDMPLITIDQVDEYLGITPEKEEGLFKVGDEVKYLSSTTTESYDATVVAITEKGIIVEYGDEGLDRLEEAELQDMQPKPTSPYAKDAEDWGDALSEANWELITNYNTVVGEQMSDLLFENCQQLARLAILKYIEEVERGMTDES